MRSKFQHSEHAPFHISVGVVLINDKGEILVHHMLRDRITPEFSHTIGGLDEAFILMRESLENDESLEQAIVRGLREEFGAEGTIRKYLGSIQIVVNARARTFEKTTLYFEVGITAQRERPMTDGESHTLLEWHTPEFLISHMKDQGSKANRSDLDESKIIETYVKLR